MFAGPKWLGNSVQIRKPLSENEQRCTHREAKPEKTRQKQSYVRIADQTPTMLVRHHPLIPNALSS